MRASTLVWLSGVLALPLRSKAPEWRLYQYEDVAPNKVSFEPTGLKVEVQQSVNPIVYIFPKATVLKGFTLEADFKGLPLRTGSDRDDYDDKAFRLGVVVPGDTKPNFLERLLIPKWTKELLSEVAESGLEKIYYYSLATASTKNLSRNTYSRFHQEKVLSVIEKPGPFSGTFAFEKPHAARAVWISIDGDDTKSSYEVVVKKLELEIEAPTPSPSPTPSSTR